MKANANGGTAVATVSARQPRSKPCGTTRQTPPTAKIAICISPCAPCHDGPMHSAAST